MDIPDGFYPLTSLETEAHDRVYRAAYARFCPNGRTYHGTTLARRDAVETVRAMRDNGFGNAPANRVY